MIDNDIKIETNLIREIYQVSISNYITTIKRRCYSFLAVQFVQKGVEKEKHYIHRYKNSLAKNNNSMFPYDTITFN